jgi:CheY-like chemotaxis protein
MSGHKKLITWLVFSLLLFFANSNNAIAIENEKDSLESLLPFAGDKDRCDILNGLAQIIKSTDTTKAGNYARQALALSTKLNYCRGKASATIIIGILHKNRSNYNEARSKYLEGLALALKCKEPYSVSLAYHSLGNLALIKGNYNTALRYYIASLKISEQLNDIRRVVKTLNNIATLYFELNNYDKAEEYYLRVNKLNNVLNDELTSAEIANNLGNIYQAKNSELKALYYYSNALAVFRRLGSIHYISSVLNNIGVIYQRRGQFNESKPFFIESFELDIKSKDYKALAATSNNLSYLYYNLNKNDSARYYADLAIKLATEHQFLPELERAYRFAAAAAEKDGKIAKANEYLAKAEKLQQSIAGGKKQIEVENISNKYEVERKAIELKLLEKENELKRLRIEEQNLEISRRNIIIFAAGIIIFFLVLTVVLFIMILNAKKQQKEDLSKYTAKLSLLGKLNHEIGTPLSSISGMAQLAMESKNFNELKEYLLGLRLSVDELIFILNNIVSYLELNNKQTQVVKVPFHFNDILQQEFKKFAAMCKHKGIVFTSNIIQGVPTDIFNDKSKILLILNNLFYHAFQSTKKGVVRIDVKSIAQKTNDNKRFHTIHIVVTDEGDGLSENQIKNLFKNPQHSQVFGIGLGLTLIKEYTRMLNGHITVTSEIGKGSEFTFEFDTQEIVNTKNAIINHTKPLTVLVAEDNLLNQKILLKILEKENIQTTVVTTGKELLNKLSEKQFDAVILNVSLPEMNGFEVTYQIRNDDSYEADKNIPIIALSANNDVKEHNKCIELGVNEYLTKPINKELLIKYLRQLTS